MDFYYHHPVFWTQKKLLEEANARERKEIEHLQLEILEGWAIVERSVVSKLRKMSICPALVNCFGLASYTWAFLVILTRAWTLKSGTQVLAPFLDMINHDKERGNQASEITVTGEQIPILRLVNGPNLIFPGQEVFGSYGTDEAHFFARYGFRPRTSR